MTDRFETTRPLRRAFKGFMSLLSGEVDTTPGQQQKFFEALNLCEQAAAQEPGVNRFQRALRRIRNSSFFEPSNSATAPIGVFRSRHIIGESTGINGGVYVGAVPQEAIVVDDRHGLLERVYNELVVRMAEISLERAVNENEILPEISALVLKHLRFDEVAVRNICDREKIRADDKVAIDMFLHEGVGVARHQVLVFAYLAERLKRGGLLQGSIGIDASSTDINAQDERLSYTALNGQIFSFDPLKFRGR